MAQQFKLIPAEQEGIEPGQTLIEVGSASFVTTGLTVEVRTDLTRVDHVILTRQSYIGTAAAGGDALFSDGVVTSGAVTCARKVSVDSGASFNYMFIGVKE